MEKELVYDNFKIILEESVKISDNARMRKFLLAYKEQKLNVYQYHHSNISETNLDLNEIIKYHDEERDPFLSGSNKEYLLDLRSFFHRINSDYYENIVSESLTSPFFIVSK